MTDQRSDPDPDDIPGDMESNPDSLPDAQYDDARSDIGQAVAARSDAVERGEGGAEPETFTGAGMPDGVGGTGGMVKNQDADAQ